MQFTLDGTTIVLGVISALWFVSVSACGIWVARVQSDSKECSRAIVQLQKELASFREAVAQKYASRDEVKDNRDETRELLERIEARLNEINTYLMQANKP